MFAIAFILFRFNELNSMLNEVSFFIFIMSSYANRFFNGT